MGTDERSREEVVGTQPAAFGIDYAEDTSSTLRPMATQAIFRPEVDVDSESTESTTVDDHTTAVTRHLSPNRRL